MSITVSLAVQLNGANAHYQFEAKDVKQADEMARFLAGVEAATLPVIRVETIEKLKDVAPAKGQKIEVTGVKFEGDDKQEPEAKKEQPAPATDTTLESGEASSDSESASDAGKSYSYDQVKQLITDLVKDGKKELAIALLSRFGMKVLAKDAAVETYNEMGAMAEGTLAGTVDPREAVEA